MDKEEYINSLNLDMKTTTEIDSLLTEYESGKLTRDEYVALAHMAHSVTHSKGFNKGWESAIPKTKNTGKNF